MLPRGGESGAPAGEEKQRPNAAAGRRAKGAIVAERGAWRSLVSALVWGTRGPRFKSGRPDWKSSLAGGCHERALVEWSSFPIPM
jgi:hypothetical protein